MAHRSCQGEATERSLPGALRIATVRPSSASEAVRISGVGGDAQCQHIQRHVVWGDVEDLSGSRSGSSSSSRGTNRCEPDNIERCARPFHLPDSWACSDAANAHQGWAQSSMNAASAEKNVLQTSETEEEEHPLRFAVANFLVADPPSDFDEMWGSAQGQASGFRIDELLTEVEITSLMGIVPADENGYLTSLGSLEHSQDVCKKACVLMLCTLGCPSGILCEWCHFPHNRKNTKRPCKGKRARRRKLMERQQAECETDSASNKAPYGLFPILPLEAGESYQDLRARTLVRIQMYADAIGGNPRPREVSVCVGYAAGGASSSFSSRGMPR